MKHVETRWTSGSHRNLTKMVVIRTSLLLLLIQHLVLTHEVSGSGYMDHHVHHSMHTDKAALLAFKRTIISDPYSKLANWIEANDVCNFTGVACNKQHHRVVWLKLDFSDLTGPLSPIISNITRLRILNLTQNHFFGMIPAEISYLRHLRYLMLDMNNFNGSLPDSFSFLSNLIFLHLKANSFSGTLPPSLFYNCTSLFNLDLSENFFTGQIREEIGNCGELWTIALYNNNLTGQLPVSLTNISSLFSIDVEYNLLSGELPASIVGKMPTIHFLHLSNNNMKSHNNNTNLEPFFAALANCTKLRELELGGMNLGGRIPSSVGRLTQLFSLLLQENKIFGSIPPEIGNLSTLTVLNLRSNTLNGTITTEISKLSSLEQLLLSYNLFTGPIPAALGDFRHLGLLDLSNNQFSGKIPASLGNLVSMSYMFLNNNLLSGSIPPSLGNCSDLYKLDLSYNKLTGRIPPEILGIHEIRLFLNLSNNLLDGPLPIELSKLKNVQEIDVSSNNLNGNIFPQISSCIAVVLLNLSHNFLEGNLPDTLGDLKNLKFFDVSWNRLSGEIPESLNKAEALVFLNLSYNNFHGMIPSGGIFTVVTYASFIGNNLCGAVFDMHACSQKTHLFQSRTFLIVFVLVVFVSFCLMAICCFIGLRHIRGKASSRNSVTSENAKKHETPDLMHNIPRVTYRELSDATGGFDEQRLIGTGSYGRVYKGVLPDGTPIAVKVLHLQSGNSTKSFNRECQVLKRIRHRNLIRIITACSLPDFKALVLPYMANGSLDSRLYPHSGSGLGSGSSDLTLIQRVNICSDIAEGMAYLHHHSPVKVIHCDLKPSNVLLNDDMTALVSDFGIARLIMTAGGGNAGVVENMGNSTANLLCGSLGYIAPEYGFGSNTSTKGDVYSFGILVLEMVTRKRPTDDMFVSGLNLQKWVKSHYHGRVEKVIDSSLVRASRDQSPEVKKMWEVAIGELIELGILCTQDSPSTRPTMLDAADDLDRLKSYLTGDTNSTFASSLGISSSTVGDD